MTDKEMLEAVKTRLGITGDYQNNTLSGYIQDVKAYMIDAGVEKSVMESEEVTGAVARGVSDLWNYGSGSAEFSVYFMQRVTQLAYKKV